MLSPPESQTPTMADRRAIGAISRTARGSDQLLYWAARMRKASSTARGKTNMAVLPPCFSWKVRSVHS
ncbi:hypothetical protein D3C75_1182260 [compost metagenome]